ARCAGPLGVSGPQWLRSDLPRTALPNDVVAFSKVLFHQSSRHVRFNETRSPQRLAHSGVPCVGGHGVYGLFTAVQGEDGAVRVFFAANFPQLPFPLVHVFSLVRGCVSHSRCCAVTRFSVRLHSTSLVLDTQPRRRLCHGPTARRATGRGPRWCGGWPL